MQIVSNCIQQIKDHEWTRKDIATAALAGTALVAGSTAIYLWSTGYFTEVIEPDHDVIGDNIDACPITETLSEQDATPLPTKHEWIDRYELEDRFCENVVDPFKQRINGMSEWFQIASDLPNVLEAQAQNPRFHLNPRHHWDMLPEEIQTGLADTCSIDHSADFKDLTERFVEQHNAQADLENKHNRLFRLLRNLFSGTRERDIPLYHSEVLISKFQTHQYTNCKSTVPRDYLRFPDSFLNNRPFDLPFCMRYGLYE